VAEQPPRSPSSLCSTPQGQFFPILSSSFPSDAAVPSHPSSRRVAATVGVHERCGPVRHTSHRGEAVARPPMNLSPSCIVDAHLGSHLQSFGSSCHGRHECCGPVRRASRRGEALAWPPTNLSPSRTADAHVGSRLQSFTTRPLRPRRHQWPGCLPSTTSGRSLWCSGSSFLAYRMID
jgi:hypothetical protein